MIPYAVSLKVNNRNINKLSTLKKTYDQIKTANNGIAFLTIHNFLTHQKIGFTYKIHGSHYIYKKDNMMVVLPRHGVQLKAGYVKQVASLLEAAGIEVEE